MKYESSILKRLIDTYGVVGNPRYISEIIKEFIVRGKERFPNLFTTSSQEGSLLPTLSVDVVTDLEETLKVCSLEGNTM